MSIVYFLFANLAEREVIHFFIPASELQEEDYERLRLAGDPIRDLNAKEYICDTSMEKWWKYIRDGPQTCNITHTYCVSIMD